MIIVRLLDSETDRDLLIEAWHFRDTAPRWFRECLDIFKETKEEYLASAGEEFHFGAFEDDRLLMVVRMIPTLGSASEHSPLRSEGYDLRGTGRGRVGGEASDVSSCTKLLRVSAREKSNDRQAL